MSCEALFNNACFLLAYLPIVVGVLWLLPANRWRMGWLAAASLVFYGFWDVRFIPLIVASAVVDFIVAAKMRRATRKKPWLVASIVFNLGVLAFFKYAFFLGESAVTVLSWIGVDAVLPYGSIVLPVGISFYTFQSMSYTIDVYRGELEPTNDFVRFLAFVTLFPQLVAGPIVRYSYVAKQLAELPRLPHPRVFATAIALFVLGLSKKVIIADRLAAFSDPLWANTQLLTGAGAWVAALGYTLQLYFDFSGYSDMAIGLGGMLGLAFPINFRAPYQALNPSDFWRRWHISLSTFLRDYLYIPLGGNRVGKARQMANMMVVMLLGGLWHGAAWTFVAWGAYHGALLAWYQRIRDAWDAMPALARKLGMFFLALIGWVLFRAPTFQDAANVYVAMFSGGWFDAADHALRFIVIGLLVIFVMTVKPNSERTFNVRKTWAAALAGLFVLCFLLIQDGGSPFLYYQF